ncbi:MAG TPA: ATP-binding protein [Pirellulaceae bacterium]|nr:ATP-binding protein [Pirellulaceae bacterium]HMO90663.1 ATP-binding protein [Pirellulaceae bacterium]HMP67758.1 ATP-binding protein [Pirellulaceae bacterium]
MMHRNSQSQQRSDVKNGSLGPSDLFFIEVIEGIEKGHRVLLDGARKLIGRDQVADLRLTDSEVSRRHAEITLHGKNLHVVDLNSCNGTFVDEQAVKDCVLFPGQVIRVGQTRIQFDLFPKQDMRKSHEFPTNLKLWNDQTSDWQCTEMTAQDALRLICSSDNSGRVSAHEQIDQILKDVTVAVSGVTDLGMMSDRILQLVLRNTPAKRSCLIVFDDTRELITHCQTRSRTSVEGSSPPISRSLFERAKSERLAILGTSVTVASQRDDAMTPNNSQRSGNVIIIPIYAFEMVIGIVWADAGPDARPQESSEILTVEHLKYLTLIGYFAFSALENARLQVSCEFGDDDFKTRDICNKIANSLANAVSGVSAAAKWIDEGLQAQSFDRIREGLRLIENHLTKARDLSKNLAAFGKETRSEFETVDIQEVLAKQIESLRRRAFEAGVVMKLHQEKPIPSIQAVPHLIELATQNLIMNAIEACRCTDGSAVDIRIESDEATRMVEIIIIDNGEGIAEKSLSDNFKAFRSTRGIFNVGLGLTVARKIAEAHRGSIEVTSQPERGSTFRLILPIDHVGT